MHKLNAYDLTFQAISHNISGIYANFLLQAHII